MPQPLFAPSGARKSSPAEALGCHGGQGQTPFALRKSVVRSRRIAGLLNQGSADFVPTVTMPIDPSNPNVSRQPDLDLAILYKLVGNDEQKFRKFAQLFVTSTEDVLQQIDACCANGDLASLAALGHRAKSTAENIGAAKLSSLCRQLEGAAKSLDAAQALALARSLRPVFEEVRSEIGLRLAAPIPPA